jgi:hypothetical protein
MGDRRQTSAAAAAAAAGAAAGAVVVYQTWLLLILFRVCMYKCWRATGVIARFRCIVAQFYGISIVATQL